MLFQNLLFTKKKGKKYFYAFFFILQLQLLRLMLFF